jgi:UDP-N-acetylglucosamine 2-epimerase
MLVALEEVVENAAPDCVLVYGDTNSTLAGGLAGAQRRVPVAHVEAGMRSFDRSMPEELNRVLTDHLSTLLLCPSSVAVDNLSHEGIETGVENVGDVMVDVAESVRPRALERDDLVRAHGVEPGEYLLVTAHRAGNVDDPDRLRRLVDLVVGLEQPVVFPLHPRTRSRLETFGLLDRLLRGGHVTVCPPLGYVEMSALLCHARAVVTDSGGLQKEAYFASVRCLTLRDSTEWVETASLGWNTLVDLDLARARRALAVEPPANHPPLYGDGHAGARVVEALVRHVDSAAHG